MLATHVRRIALTKTLASWIDRQAVKGDYASTSDLVRTAVRALRIQEEGRLVVQPISTMPAPRGKVRF